MRFDLSWGKLSEMQAVGRLGSSILLKRILSLMLATFLSTLAGCGSNADEKMYFCEAVSGCDEVPVGAVMTYNFDLGPIRDARTLQIATLCDFSKQIVVMDDAFTCVRAKSRVWDSATQYRARDDRREEIEDRRERALKRQLRETFDEDRD